MRVDDKRAKEIRERVTAATGGKLRGIRLGNDAGKDMTIPQVVKWFRKLLAFGQGNPTWAIETDDERGLTVGIFGNGPTSEANMHLAGFAAIDLSDLLADRDERKREVAVRTRAIELAVHDLNGTALRGSNQAWPGDRCTVEWMLGRARAELATKAEGGGPSGMRDDEWDNHRDSLTPWHTYDGPYLRRGK